MGDDVGTIELPVGWEIERGDLLASEDDRLVRVVDLISRSRPARGSLRSCASSPRAPSSLRPAARFS
jgi:hypothetical protein